MRKWNDILQQIHKYLNGELDARAMHQLEKEAQNDPFLMDALEGYEKISTGQQSNIDDIHARLKDRINKKERRIIPWRVISIAASIFIVSSVGVLFLKSHKPNVEQKAVARIDNLKVAPPAAIKTAPSKKLAAINVPPPSATIKEHRTVSVATIAQNQKSAAVENQPSAADVAPAPAPKHDEIFKDTTKLAQVNIVGYAAKRKVDVTESVQSIPSAALDKKSPTVENELEGKVAGMTIYKAITGIVKDESGQPIPGASIRIKGTAIGTQTNTNGYFKLDSVPNTSTLSVDFIGYNKKEIAVTKRDSLVIAMQPNSNSLSEVVVTGYGTPKEQDHQPARPAAGWDGYKKYLNNNAKSPDGKTGTVKLSFIVNTDNSLSDFNIIKSISAKTDSAAINLVTNGPGWQKSNTGKAEKVKLRIKFTGK